jgi:hypothetical protein
MKAMVVGGKPRSETRQFIRREPQTYCTNKAKYINVEAESDTSLQVSLCLLKLGPAYTKDHPQWREII